MMHVLSPDLKQKNRERAEKRDHAEKREREKVARCVHGDRGTSLQRKPDRNRQMSVVNNIAAERGKRHKKRIDRLQLDFNSDRRWSRNQARVGPMEVEPTSTNGTADGTTTGSTVLDTDEGGTGTAESHSDLRPGYAWLGTTGRCSIVAGPNL